VEEVESCSPFDAVDGVVLASVFGGIGRVGALEGEGFGLLLFGVVAFVFNRAGEDISCDFASGGLAVVFELLLDRPVVVVGELGSEGLGELLDGVSSKKSKK
jgi:hypothetical protein